MTTDFAAPPEVAPACSTAYPADVQAHCRQFGLWAHLSFAVNLARSSFGADEVTCELMQDFESDERWILVRVAVQGTPASVLAAAKEYTAKWVAATPWPQRYMIRLSFSII